VPDAILAGLDAAERAERWLAVLADRTSATYLATLPGEVVGFASAGPCRDPDAVVDLELYSMYVRAAWQGTGTADRLLTAAVGDESASLWVFEANPRARRFYARHGFAADGTRGIEPGTGVPEVRLVRAHSGNMRVPGPPTK
jgi:2-(1,2-epoxy-1,2-dihydrophenyl)acetyl-CoA isomerase